MNEPSDSQKELLRAIVAALQSPRNRFGKLEVDGRVSLRVRKAAEDIGYLVRLPHGGYDTCDHIAMLLQCYVDDNPVSICGLSRPQ